MTGSIVWGILAIIGFIVCVAIAICLFLDGIHLLKVIRKRGWKWVKNWFGL